MNLSHELFIDPFIISEISSLRDRVFLDCGCGKGLIGYIIAALNSPPEGLLVGLDLDKGYLHYCLTHRIYSDLILSDASLLPFKDNSVDIALASAIIEHMKKVQGERFLDELNRVCKEKIILSTPNIFFSQEAIDCVESQRHKSIWQVKELKEIGYRVRGIGFKYERRIRNIYLRNFFRFAITPFSWILPELGATLLAVRSKKDFVRNRD